MDIVITISVVFLIAATGVAVALGVMWSILLVPPLRRYRRAGMEGLTFSHLLRLHLHGLPPGPALDAAILAEQAELPVAPSELAGHLKAGGRPERVVRALLDLLHSDQRPVSPVHLFALDLMGHDPVEAVRSGNYVPNLDVETQNRFRADGIKGV